MKLQLKKILFDNYLDHRNRLAIILFIEMLLIYAFTKTNLYALADTSLYYELARSFWVNGTEEGLKLDFLAPTYAGGVKGYFFPLMLAFPYRISVLTGLNPEFCIQMLYILLFLALFLYVAPNLFKRFSDNRNITIPTISIIIFSQVFLYFWAGYLLFPLSDIPAAFFFLLGIVFFLDEKQKWYKYFLAGLCLTAAYNTRTIYLYPLIMFELFLIFMAIFNKTSKKNFIVGFGMILLSFITLELPQLYINIYKFSTYSLIIQNDTILKSVLRFGYYLVAYTTVIETNLGVIGKSFTYPDADKIINAFPYDGSYKSIISLYMTNIKVSFTVMLYKIFSSIDVWVSNTYIPIAKLSNISLIFRNINYIIWFLGFSCLFFIKFNQKKVILLIILLIPSLVAYLGHVETRYFVINFIMIYLLIAFWLMETVPTIRGGYFV